MPLAPPPLPYPYGALEPTIDELTMRLHHDSMQPRGQTVPSMSCSATLDALPGDKRTLVRNNGVGHLDHSLFWESMAPDDHGHPADRGWSWLVHDGTGLAVTSTANQDSPPMRGHTPLLCVDVSEHAYYLRCQNRRADYREARWNVVDWQRVAARYATERAATPEEITHDQHASCPRRTAGHARPLRPPLAHPIRRARRSRPGRPAARVHRVRHREGGRDGRYEPCFIPRADDRRGPGLRDAA